MNYRKQSTPQSVRVVVDRDFPSIALGNMEINTIKGVWDARRGYFARFKLLINLEGGGTINLLGCTLEAKPGGFVAWRSASTMSGGRSVETDLVFYNRVLEAFAAQPWYSLIGSSRLEPTALDLPPNDPLAAALKAAQQAL